MTQEYRPLLAITAGDPAGIGPEILVKCLADASLYGKCRPLVIGPAVCMEDAIRIVGSSLRVRRVQGPEEAVFEPGTMDVMDIGGVDLTKLRYGTVQAMCGEAAFQAVVTAIDLAMHGRADATVTGPLNKEALNLAGHHYSGHTEIYADYTGTRNYTMMLTAGNLRVVHVSTHVSLLEACRRVKKDQVLEVIRLADQACRDLGIANPRVAVAGLNPHAGENGMFGCEEIEEITPAIQEAAAMGIQVDGPVPADSVFSKARGGWYDIVVAMYHDQGHIPLKVAGFVWDEAQGRWTDISGVNITLGLPIIRSSVDHGTAFGKAGKGTANATSMGNAIEYAIELAKHRKI